MKQKQNKKIFRPHLDDVEKLSRGQAAKVRGTGSRGVCHRLNQEERRQYDAAKKIGFLKTRQTGYRKERRGSPACNTFRQYCDALGKACVRIENDHGYDKLVVDLTTLREPNLETQLRFTEEFLLQIGDASEIETSSEASIEPDDLKLPIWALPEIKVSVKLPRGRSSAVAKEIVSLLNAI